MKETLVPVAVLSEAIAKIKREYDRSAPPGAPPLPGECWTEIEALAEYLPDVVRRRVLLDPLRP